MIQDITPCNIPDVPTISGYYAQMAGVLAGFAFTAMVVLMTPTQVEERRERDGDGDKGVLLTLFSAFITLILATLSYSVMAGDNSAEAKDITYTRELINGVTFALSILMLFHGLTLLMEGGRLHALTVWSSRIMTVVGVPYLAFHFLSTATLDTKRAANSDTHCVGGQLPGYTSVLELSLIALPIVALVPKLQYIPLRNLIQKAEGIGPLIALGGSVALTSFSGGSKMSTPGYLFSPTAINFYIVGIFVLFLFLAVILAYGYSASTVQEVKVETVKNEDPV